MTEQEAQEWLRSHLQVSRETMEQLEQFIAYLQNEAQSQNLIAASTLDHIWARHIVDSAQLLMLAGTHQWRNWLDLGSGAGFPGLVIGIITGKPVALVESRARRIDYLQRAVQMLDLEKNVTVMGKPLERVKSEEYSVISARAFAPLPRLLNGAARFSTENTLWLLPKGRNASMELSEAQQDWDMMFHVKQSITDKDAGILVGTLRGKVSAKPQKKAILE
jgi:16S rRNA (guanine527-N7)-methyltransferase